MDNPTNSTTMTTLIKLPLDKQAHALAGAVIVQSMILAHQPMTWALLLCALIAAAKEVYDASRPTSHTKDKWDFLATCAGGGVAGLFVLAVQLWA